MKDYYAALGLPRGAEPEDIKRAFRRLARETHPDTNPDPTAEARFREIAEAYEVLSDPARRAAYDRGDQFDVSSLFSNLGGIDDLLRTFFGGGFGPTGGTRVRGTDILIAVSVSLEEAAVGVDREVSFRAAATCETCDGSGAAAGHHPVTCEACGGQGAVRVARRTVFGDVSAISTCAACNGAGTVIEEPCQMCTGTGLIDDVRSVTVQIPPGIGDGVRLRLAGRGGGAERGAPAGDLYVEVSIEADPRWRREGDDLVHGVSIGLSEAVFGTTIPIPVIEEGDIPIDIPAATSHGAVLRLRGRGMPRLRRRGRGDLLVEIEIAIPQSLSTEAEEALRAYAVAQAESPTGSKRRWRRGTS